MCSYAYVYHIGDFLGKQSGSENFLITTDWEKKLLNHATKAIQIHQNIMNKIKR